MIIKNTAVYFLIVIMLGGCGYGIVGKKTTAAIDDLQKNVVKAVDTTRDHIMQYLVNSRDSIFDFLRLSSQKEANDLSIGILQGTIGYLDDPVNRDRLSLFLDSLITHAGSAARIQLIQFKNELLDQQFVAQVQNLLRGVMRELILHPADNLLTIILSDKTRIQLQRMLTMIVPAILNDSAIRQIDKLRGTLVGVNLKRDIALLVDTALIVVDTNLNHRLRPTIKSIVEENTSFVRKNATWLLVAVGAIGIIVALIVYYIQRRKVKLNQDMLQQVTLQVERMREKGPQDYVSLKTNIKEAMQDHNLESEMHRFLTERHIHKPSTPKL